MYYLYSKNTFIFIGLVDIVDRNHHKHISNIGEIPAESSVIVFILVAGEQYR